MILVNLLQHREARRRRLRRRFLAGLAFSSMLGVVVVAGLWTALSQQIAAQASRNAYLEAGIARLDVQIKDISGLRAEMAELEARGRVVQSLQARRNVSVQLLTALADQAPAGLQFVSVRQTGQVVAVSGLALSSEHVAVLMRDATAAGSPFERAELVEVRATQAGSAATRSPDRRLVEFTLRLTLRPEIDTATAAPAAAPRR